MAAASEARRMTRGARNAFLALAVALLLVMAASPVFTVVYANSTAARQDAQARAQAATIAQLQTQLQAACGFARDLGSVPLPGKPRPSRLGVSLLADSRAQWRALRCPGELPPPSPGLAHWAAYYHLDGR